MGRIRDAWHALRGYAAAQDSRVSSWAASGSSATAEVGAAAPTVARRARDAVRNDPYPDVPSFDVCTGVRADTLEIDFSPTRRGPSL